MTATVRRRRSILIDQKRPKPYKGAARYGVARDAIVQYIVQGSDDLSILGDAIAGLNPHPFKADWQNKQRRSSQIALLDFADRLARDIDFHLTAQEPVQGSHNGRVYMMIEGVRVSLRPDVILRGVSADETEIVGIVKLHFSKSHELQKKGGLYVSTLLHQYAEESLARDGVIASRERCMVVDVRHGAIYTAPECFKRRREEIAAACEEIAQRWASL